MNEVTVGDLIAYLRDNYDPALPVVLEESSDLREDAVALPDVFQGIRES